MAEALTIADEHLLRSLLDSLRIPSEPVQLNWQRLAEKHFNEERW